MTVDEAPIGTVVTIGHPEAGHLARKAPDGRWYSLITSGYEIDYDDLHKTASAIYIPKEAHNGG